MLRSSEFDPYHQSEAASLSHTRFRFAEKRAADTYATWLAEHSIWPVPDEFRISAPQVTSEWAKFDAEPERKVREYLNSFTLERGRVVLMAKKGELENVLSKDLKWEKEPIYGTEYHVQRFNEEFILQVRCHHHHHCFNSLKYLASQSSSKNDILELYLPKPNEFIPTNLDVHKLDVAQVCDTSFQPDQFLTSFMLAV